MRTKGHVVVVNGIRTHVATADCGEAMPALLVEHVNVNAMPRQQRMTRLGAGAILLAIAILGGSLLSIGLPPLADEPHHIAQIRLFMRGRWEVAPLLTTIPGYHAIIAIIARIVGKGDVSSLRLYSLLISVATLLALFAFARGMGDERDIERTMQSAFLPIVFPYMFFLYTDLAAVLFLTLALVLQRRMHYWAAGACATVSLAVRQNYVIWFGLVAVLAYEQIRYASERATSREPRQTANALEPPSRGLAKSIVTDGAAYAVGMILFIGFVLWNGGVAIGDREMHPFPSVHLSNIYFALFLTFLLLLPLHVANLREIVELGRRRRTVVALGVLLIVFLASFTVDHPYNQPLLEWWLHNRVLAFLSASPITRLFMFAAICIASLSLAVTPLARRWHYLIYPSAVLSLLPTWQIEQRYYIMPLILFLMFRVQRSLVFEWILIAYLAVIAMPLFIGVSTGAYFL